MVARAWDPRQGKVEGRDLEWHIRKLLGVMHVLVVLLMVMVSWVDTYIKICQVV